MESGTVKTTHNKSMNVLYEIHFAVACSEFLSFAYIQILVLFTHFPLSTMNVSMPSASTFKYN